MLETLGFGASDEGIGALLELYALLTHAIGQPMMLIEADAGGERQIGTDADEHPSPLPVVDIEIILDDPAVGDLQMPAVRFTVAYCRHDARWFTRLEDDHGSIGVCPFEIGIDKVIATTLRNLYHRDVALFRPLFQPALKLLGNVPEHMPAHTTNTPEQRAKLAKALGDCRKANQDLKAVLGELHQTFDDGRNQATRVKRRGFVRKTPFVFFTRKGNLEDGILAYEEVKPMAVIKKPDPWDEADVSEEAKDDALFSSRDTIAKKLRMAIDNAGFFYQHKEAVLASLISFLMGVLANSVFLLFHG